MRQMAAAAAKVADPKTWEVLHSAVITGSRARLEGGGSSLSFPTRAKETTRPGPTDPRSRSEPAMVDWHHRIKADPAILVGKPCIKGTRMSVEFILELLAAGWTMEQILEDWDHIRPNDILACIAYAGDVLKREYERSPSYRALPGLKSISRSKQRRSPAKRKPQRRTR